MRARIEVIAAVGGGVFGIAGLAFALFTPLNVAQDCVASGGPSGVEMICRRSLTSLFDEAGIAALAGLLVPASLFAAGAIAGWAHAHRGARASRRMLWLATAALGALTVALMLSLGPFMLPGVLLLLYASLLARGNGAALEAAPAA